MKVFNYKKAIREIKELQVSIYCDNVIEIIRNNIQEKENKEINKLDEDYRSERVAVKYNRKKINEIIDKINK